MAEWSGFFDAHKVGESWDRTYLAEDFAKFFAPLIGNGVFAGRSNELQVFQSSPAGMSVIVSSGQSWIEGYGYLNDSDLTLLVDPADGALGRIDRIVNQWSAVDRQIRTIWKKGTPAVNPVPPLLQWDADYKEINLCTIDVSAGLSAITQDKITDTRTDSSVCGWVTGLIQQVDTSTLFVQWQTAYEKAFAETGDYLEAQKAAWEKFFESIKKDSVIPIPSLDDLGKVVRVNETGGGYVLDKTSQVFFPVLLVDAWVEQDDGRYVQTVPLEGILAGDYPDVDVHLSGLTTEQEEDILGDFSLTKLITFDGSVTAYFSSQPTVDIPLKVRVVR